MSFFKWIKSLKKVQPEIKTDFDLLPVALADLPKNEMSIDFRLSHAMSVKCTLDELLDCLDLLEDKVFSNDDKYIDILPSWFVNEYKWVKVDDYFRVGKTYVKYIDTLTVIKQSFIKINDELNKEHNKKYREYYRKKMHCLYAELMNLITVKCV